MRREEQRGELAHWLIVVLLEPFLKLDSREAGTSVATPGAPDARGQGFGNYRSSIRELMPRNSAASLQLIRLSSIILTLTRTCWIYSGIP